MCVWSKYSIATLWMLVVSHGVVSGVFEKKSMPTCLRLNCTKAWEHDFVCIGHFHCTFAPHLYITSTHAHDRAL